MAFLNDETKELHLKILIAGARNAGKTTNLQSIYKQTSNEVATRFFDLHSLTQRNTFFEFLPLSFGEVKTHSLRLHLYTLPAHDLFETLLLNLLSGIDGIIFTVDSRVSQLQKNEEQLTRLKHLLKLNHQSFADIPMVFQYNHRDSTQALPIKALKSQFSRHGANEFESVAVQDIGVLETLEGLAEKILDQFEHGRFSSKQDLSSRAGAFH